jgi:hypothetical protein
MSLVKRAIAGVVVAGALAIPAAPALAQPVVTGGLVNVTIVDVLSGNEVALQVPVTVAANVCGVSVAALAQDLRSGPVDCSNDNQIITVSQQRRR